MNNAEFNGIRSKLYEEVLLEFPNARIQDIQTMCDLLNPRIGDKILGIGEGNGYFCKAITKAIGTTGDYLVTDPSKDQLDNLIQRIAPLKINTQIAGAEEIKISNNYFDKVWSFGAYHHCANQTEGMKKIYSGLKTGGKLILCDVFQASTLAKHFDTIVAKYCITGHEVKFLSDEFAKTLCINVGFNENKIQIKELNQKWIFETKEDLGEFIYKLHALTLLPGTEQEKIRATINSCEEILGIEYVGKNYLLNWPMKAIVAEK